MHGRRWLVEINGGGDLKIVEDMGVVKVKLPGVDCDVTLNKRRYLLVGLTTGQASTKVSLKETEEIEPA